MVITGTMHANGEGFAATNGPGGGGANEGGTHGGVGEGNSDATYGSFTNPTSLGSGGNQTAGGGAIVLSVTGTLTVNGTLSADGEDVSAAFNDAGAGGSINITAAGLTGTGTISADGGGTPPSGSPNASQAGGGGRISLNGVTNDTFTGSLTANGGEVVSQDDVRGFAGTIYLNSQKRTTLTLGGSGNLTSLKLGSDDSNNYTFGTLTIASGGTLEIDGNPNMNSGNGGAVTINVTGSLDVQSGGYISANGLGFDEERGTGAGTTNEGGTYGGEGEDNTDATYGSLNNPIHLGSGGADRGGGGAVILNVTGTLTVNGTISANGEQGTSNQETGSGGTINITANEIEGSGMVQANGGTTSGGSGLSGGGGRIAITTSGTDFGGLTIQAMGGSANSASLRGASGTVYKEDSSDGSDNGELVIDNGSAATDGETTRISSTMTDLAVGDVTIQNDGILEINQSGVTLTVSGNWNNSATATLTEGTILFDATSSKTITPGTDDFNNVVFNGSGGTWTMQDNGTLTGDMTITAGTLTTDGYDFDIAGTMDLDGTLNAASGTGGNSLVKVDGNWDMTSVVFTNTNSTVMFATTTTATITSSGKSFYNVAINDGLVGYWKLEESSSPAVDSSGYGHNGTWVGDPTSSSTVPTVNFANNNSISLDGTDDSVSIPDDSHLDTTQVTAMAWIKTAATDDFSGVVAKVPSGGTRAGWILTVANTSVLRCDVDSGPSGGFAVSTTTLEDDAWHHVACSYDGSNIRVYVDGGAAEGTTAFSAGLGQQDEPIIIGKDPLSAAREFSGLIDEVRVYNRALSQNEITTIANGDQPGMGLGTITLQDAMDINGTLLINTGTLNVGSNNAITVAGNWDNNGGGFTEQSGLVTFDGTGQSIGSSETFYQFTKTVSSSDTITFGQRSTFTITNTATLQGAASNLLSIRSSTDGTQFKISPQGTRTFSFLNVKDSENLIGPVLEPPNSTDAGNTTLWFSGPLKGAILIVQ